MANRFSFRQFEDDYAFEDCMALTSKWQNWTLFQKHIITMPHQIHGLYDNVRGELVGATAVSRIESEDLIYIHLFQVRDDLGGQGYGQQMLRMLTARYIYECSGFKLQYTNQALGFWLKMGFEFADDMDFLVK